MTQSVFVTGAAQGIGRAIALKFARNGYRVGAFDIDDAGLSTLADEAGGLSRIETGRLDVRDPEEWKRVLSEFCGDRGLDVLVNNAGIIQVGDFTEIPLADHARTVEVNVLGVLNGCHTAYPYLQRSKGHVVNLCSASAVYGQTQLATYSATKFAVRGLTEALEIEWADAGVRVSALWPLFVNTQMVANMDIGTTRTLGIRLSAADVADSAWDIVQSPSKTGPHRGVGRQSRIFMAAAAISPTPLNRMVNRFMASR